MQPTLAEGWATAEETIGTWAGSRFPSRSCVPTQDQELLFAPGRGELLTDRGEGAELTASLFLLFLFFIMEAEPFVKSSNCSLGIKQVWEQRERSVVAVCGSPRELQGLGQHQGSVPSSPCSSGSAVSGAHGTQGTPSPTAAKTHPNRSTYSLASHRAGAASWCQDGCTGSLPCPQSVLNSPGKATGL